MNKHLKVHFIHIAGTRMMTQGMDVYSIASISGGPTRGISFNMDSIMVQSSRGVYSVPQGLMGTTPCSRGSCTGAVG
jgi:hypothetical protein